MKSTPAPGMRALLTRDRDKFIPLAQRVEIAHQLGADVFLSIHADSVESPKPMGSSVYVLSTKGASSKLARRLAKTANLSDLIGGEANAAIAPDDERSLRQITRDGKEQASRGLGTMLLRHVAQINNLHGGAKIHSAGFAVLKSPSIPSALLETAFISNPQEEEKAAERRLSKQNGRRRGRRAAGIRRSVSCRRIRVAVTRGFQAAPALTTRPAPL